MITLKMNGGHAFNNTVESVLILLYLGPLRLVILFDICIKLFQKCFHSVMQQKKKIRVKHQVQLH